MAKNLVTLNVENVDYSIRPYGTCSTAGTTAAKTVDITGFALCTGATVCVKFTNTNTAEYPTLNVNSTGAKTIKCRSLLKAGDINEFIYDGANWILLNEAEVPYLRHYNHTAKLDYGTTTGESWWSIGAVNDADNSAVLYSIRAYAHNSAIFTVSKGYANSGNITVLQSHCPGGNASYPYLKGVRLLSDGVVQIKLNNGTYAPSIDITALSADGTIAKTNSLYDNLILHDDSTSTATVLHSIDLVDTAIMAKKFVGNLTGNVTGDVTGTATNATNVNIATSSVNDNFPLLFTTNVTAGNKRIYTDSANELKYNPSTNTLTTSKFVGDLAGNLTLKSLSLCGATESDEIKIVENANNAITTNPTNSNLSSIRKALDFRWYDSHWQIGNIRAGSSASDGFGVTYGNNNLCFRVTTTNCFVGANEILHAGNYTNYTVKKDGTGASGTWGISISGNAESATKTTVKQYTSTTDTNEFPIVWSNETNTNSVSANQLYKSYKELYYSPKGKTLSTVGTLTAGNKRFNYGLAYYEGGTTVTGDIVITLPNSWSNSMNTYEIDIYEYENFNASADNIQYSKLYISGYDYTETQSWYSYGYTQVGPYNKGIRLGHNGTNCVIILGTTTTTWSYPQIKLARVITGYSNQSKWGSGYTITNTTSETGYSKIVNVKQTKQIFNEIKSAGPLTLYTASGDSPALVFQRGTLTDSATDWRMYGNAGKFLIQNNINSAGWVNALEFSSPDAQKTLTSSYNILPNANNTLDLGSNSLKWKNVYATSFNGFNIESWGKYKYSYTLKPNHSNTWYIIAKLKEAWTSGVKRFYIDPGYNNNLAKVYLNLYSTGGAGHEIKVSNYNQCNIKGISFGEESGKPIIYLRLEGNANSTCTIYSEFGELETKVVTEWSEVSSVVWKEIAKKNIYTDFTINADLNGLATNATNAANATNVDIATSSSNSDYPLLFTSNVTAGNKRVYTDTANELKYNPSTNTLNTSKIIASSKGIIGDTSINDAHTLAVKGIIYGNRYHANSSAGAALILNKGADYFGFGGSTTSVSKMAFGTVNVDGTFKREHMIFDDYGAITMAGPLTTTGSLTLYNESGDSPALVFQRGTLVDGATDWRMYVTSGRLRIQNNINNAGWVNVFEFSSPDAQTTLTSSYSITAPSFTGNLVGNATTATTATTANSAITIKQTVSSSNANYPLLLAPSGQTATNNSGGTYFDSEVTLNPSTNILNNAKVYESLIQWGNTSISGSVTPVDAAMSSEFSQNRLSFLNPDLITVEFTRNNGTNWYTYPKTYTDAGTTDTVTSGYEVITNAQKQSLVTDGLSHALYLGARRGNQTANDKLRITILGDGVGLYISLKKILFYYSQAYGNGNYCLVEAASAATPDTFTTVKQYDVSGWINWNSIPYDKSLGEWADSNRANNTRKLRLTFGVTGVTANATTDIYINKLRMFGPSSWAGGNSLTTTGHLYTFDVNKNATFPANLTTTGVLTVKGNTTLGDATSDTVTVSGTLSVASTSTLNGALTVKGNTTLGDATSDTVTINGKTTIVSGSKLTIKGDATSQPLVVRGVTGSDGNGAVGPLYLQYGANNAINLGNGGAYSISADGGTYSGTATTATNIVTSNIATTAEIEALFA